MINSNRTYPEHRRRIYSKNGKKIDFALLREYSAIGSSSDEPEDTMGVATSELGFYIPSIHHGTVKNAYIDSLIHGCEGRDIYFAYGGNLNVFYEFLALEALRPGKDICIFGSNIYKENPQGFADLQKFKKFEFFDVFKHGRISNLEFRAALSDPRLRPFAWCTGDMSLSETMALGKIPVYDYVAHKANSADALSDLMTYYGLPPLMRPGRISIDLYEKWELAYESGTYAKFLVFFKKYFDVEPIIRSSVWMTLLEHQGYEAELVKFANMTVDPSVTSEAFLQSYSAFVESLWRERERESE